MNALEHGERSAPENHYAVMRALGEDPAQFDALKQELRASFSTGDPFVEKQVDDLAYLYSRRDRLERMEGGLMRRALLQQLEEPQHRRRKEIEDCTIEAGQGHQRHARGAHRPRRAPAPAVILSGESIRLQAHGRYFLAWQAAAIEGFFKKKGGWRAARMCHLLSLFAEAGAVAPLVEGDVG